MKILNIERLKNIWAFVRSRIFLINLGIAVVLIVVSLSCVGFWLNIYTNHGRTVSVPDFKGLKPEQLDDFVLSRDVRYKIVDSVYNSKLPKGVIVDQVPVKNFKVKQGRTIYLTMNIYIPPQVRVPNLKDVPQKQAEAILQTYGLKIGRLIYQPNLNKNSILDIQVHGIVMKPGAQVRKGTVVDLVLGDGVGEATVGIPNLLNLSYQEALVVLKGSGLSAGSIVFDNTVKDTAMAIVYKQNPPFEADTTRLLSQGQRVDLYLTQSPEKLKTSE